MIHRVFIFFILIFHFWRAVSHLHLVFASSLYNIRNSNNAPHCVNVCPRYAKVFKWPITSSIIIDLLVPDQITILCVIEQIFLVAIHHKFEHSIAINSPLYFRVSSSLLKKYSITYHSTTIVLRKNISFGLSSSLDPAQKIYIETNLGVSIFICS